MGLLGNIKASVREGIDKAIAEAEGTDLDAWAADMGATDYDPTANEERRLWDTLVKRLTEATDPREFSVHEDAQMAAALVTTFADEVVRLRRSFFDGEDRDER